jgi:protein-tyrosine-phosphatase
MEMKKVLFVCVENSCRSQMAEAFARLAGRADLEIYSAGSNPSGVVNPKAIESMKEIGYDLSRHGSKSLSQIPELEYDVVVTMGCGDKCPFVRAKKREDWEIPDPKHLSSEEFKTVRDEIKRKVKELLTKLSP